MNKPKLNGKESAKTEEKKTQGEQKSQAHKAP
jgi:hypothetical protein